MKRIEFDVCGSPVSQPRQRHRLVETKDGRKYAMNYTPAKDPVQDWKAAVRQAARQAGAAILMGPVYVRARFYLPRPQKFNMKKYPEGPIPHAGSKDIDNLYKAVADCLIGICYQDDRQIARVSLGKFYHERYAGPRAHIIIEEIVE